MTGQPQLTPTTALRYARWACFALLAFQLVFAIAIVVLYQVYDWTPTISGTAAKPLLWIGIGFGILSVPMAAVVRKVIWTRAGGDQQATLMAFVQGAVMFVALLESGATINLVFWLITGDVLPYAAIAGALFVIAAVSGIPRRRGQDPSGAASPGNP